MYSHPDRVIMTLVGANTLLLIGLNKSVVNS